MSDLNLRHLRATPVSAAGATHLPIGRYLVENGVITRPQLKQALSRQRLLRVPLGEILVAEGWVSRADIQSALSQQHGLQSVSIDLEGCDAALARVRPAAFWLQHGVIPWIRIGDTVMVATSRPDQFQSVRAALSDSFPTMIPVLADKSEIQHTISRGFSAELAEYASTRVDASYSFRTWDGRALKYLALMLPLGLCAAIAIAPDLTAAAFVLLAAVCLALFTSIKIIGLTFQIQAGRRRTADPHQRPIRIHSKPRISMLVPLYKEREIATHLIRRLERLTYPKALLDVILVLEAHDTVTRDTLAKAQLPFWMRILEVPGHNGLTTKPRAMNYALDFCAGDIVGVWDAEDAPAPDQLDRVARKFAQVPDDVACLQGVLDFYNPRTNWLSRCFTIEYASWFRIVLAGLANLGLVIPLGGTTLFMKRSILTQLGGWDAHNVTEDADLGVRIYRAGYRTELINSVTYEEANCRPWPWIKQRSRWLKGFMVTYLVHMRRPGALLRDLGPRRFLGVQAFFLGTLGQFLLAPVLWSFWLVAFGYQHPAETWITREVLILFSATLVGLEILSIGIATAAMIASGRPSLIPWSATMTIYFVLGTAAAYKALYELIWDPFFWDKTEHGHHPSEPVSDPVSAPVSAPGRVTPP